MSEPVTSSPSRRGAGIPLAVGAGVLLVFAIGAGLVWRAGARLNQVPLSAAPRPVTVVAVQATTFRESRTYVGTLRPWIEAQVGPQFISAYIDTVLVRPGATVKRGEVLATLDCRNASAASQAVAAEARAIDSRQRAVADEAARLKTLLDGGFVSPNEAEQKEAQSVSEEAQLASQRAKLAATSLEVNDCVMRAPFDGEVATRAIDPGAFVRPGTAIVSVVDRSTVRMNLDVPEEDFPIVAPGVSLSVHIVATDRMITGTIARRSPSADADTRTVHVEIDLSDPDRKIPVNTTGEVRIEVGEPQPASAVPLDSATLSGAKATIFLAEQGIAHKRSYGVRGERGGTLFLDSSLPAGTPVITEGRAVVHDGESVAAKEAPFAAASASAQLREPGR